MISDNKVWRLIKAALADWDRDNVQRLSAALAFYTLFSLAPLLIILIAIAGAVFGRSAAEAEIVHQMGRQMGPQAARTIQAIISNASQAGSQGTLAVVLGSIALAAGATAVFSELQDALNIIWDVQPRPGSSIRRMLWRRFVSFLIVIATGVLLIGSLVLSAVISWGSAYAAAWFHTSPAFWEALNFLASFGATVGVLTVVYHWLPDVKVEWKGALVGALVSAMLFTIGKSLLGLYLGRNGLASAYGAAGSLVIILFWIYYSTQIIFLGAEFAEVWVNEYGSGVEPEAGAVLLHQKGRVEKGRKKRERRKHEEQTPEEPKRAA